MFGQISERTRRAIQVLSNINDLIKREQYDSIATELDQCPFTQELGQVFDKDGQSIFFKLVFLPSEEKIIAYVQRFSASGGNLRRRDNNKQSMLYYAARYEKVLLVRYLLNQDFVADEIDYMQQTPLFYSAKYNKSTQVAKLLIDNGCDLNHKDANGQTALFYSAAEGNINMCRLLVENGANVLATDKNKQRPMHYAKKNGHRQVYQYLASTRNDYRKIKEIKQQRRMQESSQNTGDRRKKEKRQSIKNQYCLAYTNQNGQVKVLSFQELINFKKSSMENAKLVNMMIKSDQQIDSLPPPVDRRFERIVSKILTHFMRHQNGPVFSEPVNYQALGLFDYPTIVKYPMDFSTIKRKIAFNAYQNQLQFQGDMNLVFDNCILYNGTDRDIGKIALQMKTQFNAMFIKEFS